MSEAAEQTANMGIKAVETGFSMLGSLVKGAVSMVAMTAFLAMQKGYKNTTNRTYQKLNQKKTLVFTIPAKKLRDFARFAKQYHIEDGFYSVVDRKYMKKDCDIVVAAEYAPIVERIAGLLDVDTVLTASFEAPGSDGAAQAAPEAGSMRVKDQEPSPDREYGRENTLAELLNAARENGAGQRDEGGEQARPDFPIPSAEKNGEAPSGNSSPSRNSENLNKPSVKLDLKKIVQEQQEAKTTQHNTTRQKPASRTAPHRPGTPAPRKRARPDR